MERHGRGDYRLSDSLNQYLLDSHSSRRVTMLRSSFSAALPGRQARERERRRGWMWRGTHLKKDDAVKDCGRPTMASERAHGRAGGVWRF